MEIGSVDDFSSLDKWLESEDAGKVQRHLEERIIDLLFSYDVDSTAFKRMVAQLAWIGCRAETRELLQKDIIALHLWEEGAIEQCGWWEKTKKTCSKVIDFIKEHPVEILVGVALSATGFGLVGAGGYTLSAAVGGVVVAGAGSIFETETPVQARPPLPDPKACSKEELVALQHSLSSSFSNIKLPSSLNEVLVTADGIWAGGQFFSTESLKKQSLFSSALSQNTDWKTLTYSAYLAEQLSKTISHQMQGETALALGDYKQAEQSLEKAIEENPNNLTCYLERSSAHFRLGEYASAIKDYHDFAIKEYPEESVYHFSGGFAKGLPKGVYESGEGLLLFLVHFAKHPVHTSKQVIDAITTLIHLVRKDEWGLLADTLAPEIHQLVTEWDHLSPYKKGELAGYAIGKHGADILFPGALAKIASKSAQAAQELASVCKNLKLAEETLLLEAASGIGSPIKVAEIIEMGKKTATLGEELGFTAQEMGQLKQAGKLEGTIARTLEDPALQETFALHKKAQEALKSYAKKPMAESRVRELIHETGIPTFPRPEGIPESYIVAISDKGAGMKYIHPSNEHTFIRIMPGKPHSPFPYQQKPYVNYRIDGKSVDKYGKIAPNNSPEAHIPYEEFIYRGIE